MNTLPHLNGPTIPVMLDEEPRKQCTHPECRTWYPLTLEYWYRSKRGWHSWCKNCVRAGMEKVRNAPRKEPVIFHRKATPDKSLLSYFRKQHRHLCKQKVELQKKMDELNRAQTALEHVITELVKP